jgi:hypothetical protein
LNWRQNISFCCFAIYLFIFFGHYLLAYLWFDYLISGDFCIQICIGTSLHQTLKVHFRLQLPSGNWWCFKVGVQIAKFVLIYAHFTFVTTLCGPLKWLDHLFDKFHNLCLNFCTVWFRVGSIFGVPISFRMYLTRVIILVACDQMYQKFGNSWTKNICLWHRR